MSGTFESNVINIVQGGGGGSGSTSGLTYTTVSLAGNTTALNGRVYFIDTTAARTVTLPAASNGFWFELKDASGLANTNFITVARAAAESIEGVASNLTLQTNWGAWVFVSDGTNWFLI